MQKEVRSISIPAQIEERADGKVGSIVGYPIVYNKDSEDMGFIEKIAPGAVTEALKRSDIRGLKNHDPSLIFARQGVNLTLTEDEKGLKYVATPVDTRTFKDVADEVKSGLLTGQSFGFTVIKDEWRDIDTNSPRRTITEIGEIYDVGPVSYPAYKDTSVALRSLDAAKHEVVEPAPTFTLAEIVTLTIDGEEFVFDGEDRFDLAAEKIEEVRASSIPTNPVDADTESDPTIIDDEVDDVTEKYLERVSKTLQRSKQ